MAGAHHLNFLYQLMAIRSSSGFAHLRLGAFHIFYKYTTDIIYITESGRKKNKQEWTLVSPKHKKGKVLALFWYSMAITSVYQNKIPTQHPGTLTHPLSLADLASRSTSPNSSLQQPPLLDHCLFLTVTNCYLFTGLGPCLSSFSSSLVGNLIHKPFVWVLCQNRQRNPLIGAHPHPQNECSPSCHSVEMIPFCLKYMFSVLLAFT